MVARLAEAPRLNITVGLTLQAHSTSFPVLKCLARPSLSHRLERAKRMYRETDTQTNTSRFKVFMIQDGSGRNWGSTSSVLSEDLHSRLDWLLK